MSVGIWFWILYVIFVIFGGYSMWPQGGNYRVFGFSLITMVLIGLLGWGQFGPPISGGGNNKT